jgi:phosphoserine aminotransferase
VFDLVARWLQEDIGGLTKMEERNRAKAKLLYDVIDQSSGFYRPHAQADCRSQMNVTFRLPSEEIEKQFLKQAEQQRLVNLKGHRSVGGIRASIYNAMPVEGVTALRDFMKEFLRKNG